MGLGAVAAAAKHEAVDVSKLITWQQGAPVPFAFLAKVRRDSPSVGCRLLRLLVAEVVWPQQLQLSHCACWCSMVLDAPSCSLPCTLQAWEEIADESKRLAITQLLCNAMRAVLASTPGDLLPALYLCSGRVAASHTGIEVGVGDSILIKVGPSDMPCELLGPGSVSTVCNRASHHARP